MEKKIFNIRWDDPLRKRVKVAAAMNDLSVQAYIERILTRETDGIVINEPPVEIEVQS